MDREGVEKGRRFVTTAWLVQKVAEGNKSN